MIHIYTQTQQGYNWLNRYQKQKPVFACVLGFTETGLIPGISAAGATPADRRYTAIADAEFLVNGPHPHPTYPLPPLDVGASPVLISRAVVERQGIPVYLLNAGLPHPPVVPCIELGGTPARCLSQANALDLPIVEHLLKQGLLWGEKLAAQTVSGYVILGECVVGGTTTALAVLTGLKLAAAGKVNSSHPTCNHSQKWKLVEAGLRQAGLWEEGRGQRAEGGGQRELGDAETRGHGDAETSQFAISTPHTPHPTPHTPHPTPFQIVAAVGDPMQIVVAGMAIAASRSCGVMLAGGTQMLAVYALLRAIAQHYNLSWRPEQIVVGTTRWVAEDPTGDTVGLAELIGDVPLMATQLNFSTSRFRQLQAYEQGFVKEGVGAGGCAIAAHLFQGWGQAELLEAIEQLAERHRQARGEE
ncbi:nicotinate-nucleotide--dimethylbenzimidazole phosphoribosyltransferase [Kovacikia minuta CCNUW1]|nr:nicotinate-nucleotide--dimethylbenzimidazole phosphoribosyltransferase [Kovacikia minuta]UBF29731.1 nicotinate-nucleotide--dimethylbenzimidazole phosphoribosyltransferase [Kovacikia minuta CCNUW1]